MGIRFIVKQTPPGPDYFLDNMDNGDNWVVFETNDAGRFSGGRWEKYKANGVAQVDGSTLFQLEGEWEVIIDFDIDSLVGTPTSAQYMQIYIDEPSEGKSKDSASFKLQGDSAGDLEWDVTIISNGSSQTAPPNWGPFNTGSYRLKVRKNVGSTITFWMWTGSQWEWDGDTNGYTTSGTSWGSNIGIRMNFYVTVESPSILGGFDTVEQTAGTWSVV